MHFQSRPSLGRLSRQQVFHVLLRRSGYLFAFLCLTTACSDSNAPSEGGVAYVRVINSLFRGSSPSTATPTTIDFLVDSSSESPGTSALAANGISSGAQGYTDVTPGVHDFVARVAGDTAAYSSVYTNSTGLPFLPHQMLVSRAYYTLIVAGVIPTSGQIPNNTVPFIALLDDPFPGATVGDTTQARITLVNAAPFASASGNGQTVVWYVTPGATPPAVLTNYPAMGAAAYRAASQPININPGQYTVTVKSGANLVAQQSITVGMGEVRTLVLQSTGYAATPGIANHQLISLTKSAQ